MLLKCISFISLTAKGSTECFKSQEIFRIWKTNGSHNFLNLQNSQYFTRFTKSLWESLIPLPSASRRIHEAPVYVPGSGKFLPKRQIWWYQMNGQCSETGFFLYISSLFKDIKDIQKKLAVCLSIEVGGNLHPNP